MKHLKGFAPTGHYQNFTLFEARIAICAENHSFAKRLVVHHDQHLDTRTWLEMDLIDERCKKSVHCACVDTVENDENMESCYRDVDDI